MMCSLCVVSESFSRNIKESYLDEYCKMDAVLEVILAPSCSEN